MFKRLSEKNILKAISPFMNIEGWLTENEALGLYLIASRLKKNATVVEIGSWQGKSTYCIAKGLRSGKIYAIDPFNADAGQDTGSEQEYQEKKGSRDLLAGFTGNMQQLKVMNKIVVKKGYSQDFSHEFTGIDFLFIDGDHSVEGCKSDYELYAPKVAPGGFIAFHDYYRDRPDFGPTYVVDNLILKTGDFKFLRQHESLWIGWKI